MCWTRLYVNKHKWAVRYMCVRYIDLASVLTIFLSYFGTAHMVSQSKDKNKPRVNIAR